MDSRRKFAALLGAGALAMALAAPAQAVVVWATVTGHDASTSENNEASFWGEDCTKLNQGDGDLAAGSDTYILSANYTKVIVKAGSTNQGDPNTLTIFDNPSAGETVWADYNPDGVFGDGDKQISHIIFCGESEETTTTTTTEETTTEETTTEETTTTTTTTEETTTTTTTTFTQDTGAETDAPTLPPTATIGTDTSTPADSSWLLVMVLGVLLASVVILTPAGAKIRR